MLVLVSLLGAEETVKVTREKCTGEEWKGTGNNLDITSVNTLPDSSNLIPYADIETAYLGARDYKKEGSAYYQLLTGKGENWDLTVLDSPAKADALGSFESVNYTENKSDGWKSVVLPASWTSYGFDHSIYTNSQMPFEEDVDFPLAPQSKNPVGLYRKTFTVKDSLLQENGKVYITFAGVESAYYLYVNGKEAGYAEDSYDPHTFDITDLLNKKGEENAFKRTVKLEERREPLTLRISAKDIAKYDLEDKVFTPARFNLNESGVNNIITSLGEYVIVWN